MGVGREIGGSFVPWWQKVRLGVLVPWWHEVYLGALCHGGIKS